MDYLNAWQIFCLSLMVTVIVAEHLLARGGKR